MLVSIIINNYNYGKFIRLAMESALAQTYGNVEVIVVDDGSIDDSCEVIRRFEGRVITIFKANGGQASAFNAGFAASSGKLIMFLDSDDLLYPEAASRSVAKFEKNMSKIHYRLAMIDEHGDPLNSDYPPGKLAEGELLADLLTDGSYRSAPTSGNVFSREFLNAVMPIPADSWKSHADCYLIHTAPFYGEIGALHECLGAYRVHTTSLSLASLSLNGQVSSPRIRVLLRQHMSQTALIDDFCRKHGMKASPNNKVATVDTNKLRLASLIADRENHPFKGDSPFSVAIALIRGAIASKKIATAKKAGLMVWAIALVVLPRFSKNKVILLGLAPEERSPTLARLARAQGPYSKNRKEHRAESRYVNST